MNNQKYFYNIFGLTVESSREMPCFEMDLAEPEVVIIWEKAPFMEVDYDIDLDPDVIWYNVSTNTLKITLEGVATFFIHEGREIAVLTYPGARDIDIFMYLLGSIFGSLLLQRGVYTLHGSSVVIDQNIFTLIGESGAGKSSLAAGFVKRGYKITSDDVVRVVPFNDIERLPIVHAGFPNQRVWVDVIEQLDIEYNPMNFLSERRQKYVLDDPDRFSNVSGCAKAVIEIVKSSEVKEIKLERLEGAKALQAILNNTYRFDWINILSSKEDHFRYSVQLSSSIPIYRLSRPCDGMTVDQQIDVILSLIVGVQ